LRILKRGAFYSPEASSPKISSPNTRSGNIIRRHGKYQDMIIVKIHENNFLPVEFQAELTYNLIRP
jgi:hypothetical protein